MTATLRWLAALAILDAVLIVLWFAWGMPDPLYRSIGGVTAAIAVLGIVDGLRRYHET